MRLKHPRCPYVAYFADIHEAQKAGQRLGSVPIDCTRCGGFHLQMPGKR
ncbi:hypothetical protein K1T35_48155 (plasmid) [Pseudonocardia sp. DSM 110487]|nr:hypothetical protein [Pseudonocardia sp. DSM 110487]QYN41123.1 hypothetical protein K1T35_48155 [Pseudonocardia sp. DSM 110487]